MRNGTTLLELTTVLTLLGVLMSLAVPRLTSYRDRAIVLGAREGVIGLVTTARRLAVERGGATLHLRTDPARAFVVSGNDTVFGPPFGSPEHPALALGSGRSAIELPFDGLGLGRFTSATIRLTRGDAAAAIVVSAYGRARRR
jgi:type II secretory pathway pseudopilin PulG